MSQYFAPARRALFAGRASPVASTSAYTLSGWVRPVSSSSSSSAQPILNDASSSSTTSAAAAAAESSSRPTTHFRVTLRRSAIGLPSRYSRTLVALGLTKRLQSVFVPQNQAMAGAILRVKELVHVDNVRRLDPPVGRLNEEDAEEELRAWHSAIKDEDAIWIDAKGDVVDWGRESRRAPRGYRVVGNLISEERDEQIRLQNAAEAAAVEA